jgi:hypothetical protein
MSERATRTLLDYVDYLPGLAELGLSADELRQIPAHETPDDGETGEQASTIGLGDLMPGAPPPEPGLLVPAGTRQLYAYEREVTADLWAKLRTATFERRPSGFEKESLLSGTPDVVVRDEEGRG